MIIIGNLKNRIIVLVITLLIISLIGFLDYITGEELSFSIFYLIPISVLSLYRGTTVYSPVISSTFAAILWFLAEYYTGTYSSIFFPIWNAFVRLVIYLAIGLLLLYFKEKDKKLNQVNSNLKSLNDEKNKFIGIAAHDLRNPVSGINSLSELLIEEYHDTVQPRVIELLDIIKSLSNNTLAVLKDLLDVSKIESGKVDLQLKSQDYVAFIRHQIFLNQILARHKNINISLDSTIESLIADFDNHYLSEAIDNLLSNAIKYSYNDSEITVKISLLDNRQILTEVIDKGKGIPEEEQQRLFNYFQKTSTQPTGGETSTGLGLAIVKKIISLHKGEIGVKSASGQGSDFYYTLPI
jgi:signal transduction histidine kinase